MDLGSDSVVNKPEPQSHFHQTTITDYILLIRTIKVRYQCTHENIITNNPCNKSFYTLRELETHAHNKHPRGHKRLEYRKIIVDSRYIERVKSQCRTQKLIFNHRYHNNEDSMHGIRCEEHKVFYNSCNNKSCPKCEGTRKLMYMKKYSHFHLLFKQCPKLLTLTFQEKALLSKMDKKTKEKQARNMLKRLMRKYEGKIQFIRAIELKEQEDGTFYYHYHFLIDVGYIDQRILSQMWFEISGNRVVDIRSIRNRLGVPVGNSWSRLSESQRQDITFNYVVKYLAKPIPYTISDGDYGRYVYGHQFVATRVSEEKRKALHLMYVSNLSINPSLICPKCSHRFFFDPLLTESQKKMHNSSDIPPNNLLVVLENKLKGVRK